MDKKLAPLLVVRDFFNVLEGNGNGKKYVKSFDLGEMVYLLHTLLCL